MSNGTTPIGETKITTKKRSGAYPGLCAALKLPKKGKSHKQEQEEENHRRLKQLRNKHSAVESNSNEPEHRGLDRFPDRGYKNFKRYGLAGSAYDLRRIGQELIAIRYRKEQAEGKKRAAA